MKPLRIGSLFSGIDGLALGLEQAGLGRTVWQVEKDEYCRKVLAKHWPDVRRYDDVYTVGAHNLEPVDLICGGFPCQPFSLAGKRRGTKDDRHLWPEYLRIVTELRPAWVIGENVPGIINMELDTVLADLEGAGYETAAFIIPACSVQAIHRRDRIFVIANTKSIRWHSLDKNKQERCTKINMEEHIKIGGCGTDIFDALEWPHDKPISGLIRDDTGLSKGVDRLRCLGNAVVPQVSMAVGLIIKEWRETYEKV